MNFVTALILTLLLQTSSVFAQAEQQFNEQATEQQTNSPNEFDDADLEIDDEGED